MDVHGSLYLPLTAYNNFIYVSLNAFIFIFQAISTDVNNRVMLIAC